MEHKLRLSHRWERHSRTVQIPPEEGSESPEPREERVAYFVCTEKGRATAGAEAVCAGCGAVIEPKDLEANIGRWTRSASARDPWLLDKVYNEVVAPCGCERCTDRRAAFPNYAGLEVAESDGETVTITAADVDEVSADELRGD